MLANLTAQQREDITSGAQHALRLIAFRRIHLILGMESRCVDDDEPVTARKRSLDTKDVEAERRS